jgi:hypothetical protein
MVTGVEILRGNPVLAAAASENIKTWKFRILCKDDANSGAPAAIDFRYDFKLEGVVQSNPKTDFEFEYPNEVRVKSSALHWLP